MAFPPHIQTALKILPHLVEVAKKGERTTYEELAAAANVDARMLSKPLAFIRDGICQNHGLPPLTVIIDNKGKDRIINSFSPEELTRLSGAEYEALRTSMAKKVYEYGRWDVAMAGVERLFCLT